MDTDAIRMPPAKRFITGINKRRYQPIIRNKVWPDFDGLENVTLSVSPSENVHPAACISCQITSDTLRSVLPLTSSQPLLRAANASSTGNNGQSKTHRQPSRKRAFFMEFTGNNNQLLWIMIGTKNLNQLLLLITR